MAKEKLITGGMRESVPDHVQPIHVQEALTDLTHIRLETVARRIDWAAELAAAAPFQPRAGSELAESLRVVSILRGTVAGSTIAISNAFDWGEQELMRAIASAAFGDSTAVTTIDLSVFSDNDAIAMLLTPTGMNEFGEGSSLLSRVVGKRQYGVLAYKHSDRAHPALLRFLAEAAAAGFAKDFRGRDIWMRTFASIFLLSEPEPRPLGFGQKVSVSPPHPNLEFSDAYVRLDVPDLNLGVDAIIAPVLEELGATLGMDFAIEGDASELVRALHPASGLTAARRGFRGRIAHALVDALDSGSGVNLPRARLVVCGEEVKIERYPLTPQAVVPARPPLKRAKRPSSSEFGT